MVNGIKVINSFSLNIAITKEKIPKRVIVKNNLGKINIHNSKKTNENPGIANYRGIGVSEMVDSINNKRLNRCSGELSLHVLDILDTIIKSSENDKKLQLRSSINEVSYFGENEINKLLN